MRRRAHRSLALFAVGALALAACGDDATPEDQDATEQTDGADDTADAGDGDPLADQPAPEDPNDDIVDGVYRGQGVVLPVPDGWTLDPNAFAQGVVAAVSEDGTQQLSAQALDVDALGGPDGEGFDLDELLESVRGLGEAEVDEEIDLDGAERAQRLTFLDLPAQQEGMPSTSATIILAEDGEGLVGEFAYGSTGEERDEAIEELFLSTAGFDPDSEPTPPAPQPLPDELPEELLDELSDDPELDAPDTDAPADGDDTDGNG